MKMFEKDLNFFHFLPIKCLLFSSQSYIIKKLSMKLRRSGGMADATDSKSVGSDTVWVQVPPSAPKIKDTNSGILYFFIIHLQFFFPNTTRSIALHSIKAFS